MVFEEVNRKSQQEILIFPERNKSRPHRRCEYNYYLKRNVINVIDGVKANISSSDLCANESSSDDT